jgi:aryl-alcohol dehydrogenase-like predicted oxidoreductase
MGFLARWRRRTERAMSRLQDAAGSGAITLGGDLSVPRLGFGAMRVTGDGIWGEPRQPLAARELLQRVVASGVRLLDTADSYGPEVSERLIAEALHPYASGVVVATKGGIVRPDRPTWARDGRPAHLRAACEASLARLRIERIDLYQLHAIDPRVPLEDSLGELARLQAEGKIRHVGVSNFNVDELVRARRVVRVVSVQNRYNVVDRSSDVVVDYCEREGLAFLPWSPLVQGPGDAQHPRRASLGRVAVARGISLPQAAIVWLLTRSPAMLPIPGTGSLAHFEELVAVAGLRFTPEEMRAIG